MYNISGWAIFIGILLIVAVIGGSIALIVFVIKSLVDSAKLNSTANAQRQQMYNQNMYPNQQSVNNNNNNNNNINH